MNIYLLERDDAGYEEWDGFVIVAKSVKEAKTLAGDWYKTKFSCKKIDAYTGKRKKPFIVLGSWTGM